MGRERAHWDQVELIWQGRNGQVKGRDSSHRGPTPPYHRLADRLDDHVSVVLGERLWA